MERTEFARLRPGAVLWVEDTGERVAFKWLTIEGVRCATAAGDRTYWLDEIVDRQPEAKAGRHQPLAKARRVKRERAARRESVSERQMRALETLSMDDLELWYHDLGSSTADALLARGWVKEVGSVRCSRVGHSHPGALAITAAGVAALREGRADCAA